MVVERVMLAEPAVSHGLIEEAVPFSVVPGRTNLKACAVLRQESHANQG